MGRRRGEKRTKWGGGGERIRKAISIPGKVYKELLLRSAKTVTASGKVR